MQRHWHWRQLERLATWCRRLQKRKNTDGRSKSKSKIVSAIRCSYRRLGSPLIYVLSLSTGHLTRSRSVVMLLDAHAVGASSLPVALDTPSEEAAQPEHAHYCFSVLHSSLFDLPKPKPSFEPASYPLFVTWNTLSRGSRTPRLRGCIGNFDAMPLDQGLAEYALTSAFKDRRFSPIAKSELPRLECGCVSVTPFFPFFLMITHQFSFPKCEPFDRL
jgi:hypothetical protein